MSALGQDTGWFISGSMGENTAYVWVDMMFKALPPEMVEMARACALPAHFDMRLFILLTGKGETEAIAFLSTLVAAEMVASHGQSSYVYHKAARDYLRASWRAPERRDEFERLAHRLGGYYLMLAYEQVLSLNGPDRKGVLEALDKLYPNVEAAWESILATQNWAMVCNYASLMDVYHAQRAQWAVNVTWLQRGIAACIRQDNRESRAALQNSLGVSYMQLTTGDEVENTREAITCYQDALKVYTPKTAPMDYAMVQNNLGNAYARLPSTGEPASVQHAIACYTEASRHWTMEAAPVSHAMVQNNLGNAYATLTSGDRKHNLQRAIECYTQSLQVYTAMSTSPGYAELQFKLGKSYAALPGGWQAEKRSANLRRAIACYKAVLTVYTVQDAPLDYAETQIELGNVYMQLSDDDQVENLHQAIACYKEALNVWLRDVTASGFLQPVIVQEKLTSAYLDLARLYLKQGKVDRIQALYQEIKKFYSYDHP
jgi:tetratricopeptide (TPR) repeat protein